MASGFLDFINNAGDYIPGGTAAIPAWLTGLLVKKPQTNLNDVAPLYQQMAQAGAAQNRFADENAAMYNNEYRPGAIRLNADAQRIGSEADLREAGDRGAANFQSAYGAQRAALGRDMRGINPNSGGAMAREGALRASYAPGLVNSMNSARAGREDKGMAARAAALPFLATAPNYSGGGMQGSAAAGLGGLASLQNNMYRQEAADTVKALKMPWDLQDEQDRKAESKRRWDDQMASMNKILGRFGGAAPSDTTDYTFGFGS